MSYSGHKITTLGKTVLTITHKRKFYPVPFHIVDKMYLLLLGHSQLSNMVSRIYINENPQSIMKHYSDVFECLEGEYKIHTDESVRPIVHAPRKVPFASKSKVNEKLDKNARSKSYTKGKSTYKPGQLCGSSREKRSNKVRICIDPRDLNRAIKREHYSMKTVEGVAVKQMQRYLAHGTHHRKFGL